MNAILSSSEYRKSVKRVMSTIGFQSRNMNLLKTVNGETPLVIALPNESMQDVMQRLHDAGGSANIVVVFAKRVVIFPLTAKKPSGIINDLSLTKTVSVGMFLESARNQKIGTSFRLVLGDRDFEAEYQPSEQVFEYSS